MNRLSKRFYTQAKELSDTILALSAVINDNDIDDPEVEEVSNTLVLLNYQMRELVDDLESGLNAVKDDGVMKATSEVKSIKWDAIVTRADGTVEDLGTISSYDKDEPAKNIGKSKFAE